MLEQEMLKQIYDYLLDSESGKNEVRQINSIGGLREFLRLYEDGLTWKEIKDHLEKGCHCKELKGEEAHQALKEGLEK